MPLWGRYHGPVFGPDEYVRLLAANSGNPGTFAMAALNTGWCARFTAPDTRDLYGVWLNWNTITAAGTIRIRAETIDNTSGKPSGTLYDANATIDITPVAGWGQSTFASHPTTGLVAGNEYGLVLLTTVGGTTMTLASTVGSSSGAYPTIVLTAADGTTRTNFAEVSQNVPIITFVFSDGSEETLACVPYASSSTNNIFGTAAAGLKFTVPTGATLPFAGYEITCLTRVGTPAGDLRLRVFNSSDATVSGTTVSVSRNSLTGVNSRRCQIPFPAVVNLAAGTYRVVLDSASSVNSSNCWRLFASKARAATLVPSGFLLSTTADVTAGTISWTDTSTDQPPLGLILDDITAAGGGGGGLFRSSIILGGLSL